ncbi:hypothetical protein BV25DRAFT_292958 [Artomyces pyxidatus]|uniref:Uncharacterized protein n=1 Tax=Artomyces pyxidatus TaxID=48021 RepID=A0ACB8T619_9AGAM|nr:hypothetical protein BV25DRAFT_292958 [Artomyces pyxidatus]
MTTHFFKIADDVLLEILEVLEYQPLLACLATCRRLRRIISESTSLQYKLELAACGMLDGPRNNQALDLRERLRRLRLYDAAWRQPGWAEPFSLPHLVGRFTSIDVTGALVFQASNVSARGPLLQQIPSSLRGVQEWHKILPRDTIVELIDPSQDLLAFMQNISTSDVRLLCCQISSLSTGEAHRFAAPHPYALAPSRMLLNICNDYILETLCDTRLRWEHIVWNWKTGVVEMWPGYRGYQPFHFLDDTHILVVESNDYGIVPYLRVFPFRDTGTGSKSAANQLTAPSYCFILPHCLRESRQFVANIAPRCSWGGLDAGYFYSDPDDRLLSLHVSFATPRTRRKAVCLDIPLQTLRAYMAMHPATQHTTSIPWSEWGPHGTRVTSPSLSESVFSENNAMNGMRRITVNNPLNSRITMAVLDYHPRRVARALARQRHGAGDGGAVVLVCEEEACSGFDELRTSLPCIAKDVRIPEELKDLSVTDMMSRVYLCEDGVRFLDHDGEGLITKSWMFTF